MLHDVAEEGPHRRRERRLPDVLVLDTDLLVSIAHVDLRASFLSLYLLLPEYLPKDTDRSGTIGFNEFAGLWKYIKEWQGVYKHFDKDHSGSIDGKELKDALSQFGYKLSPEILTTLERKYGEPSSF